MDHGVGGAVDTLAWVGADSVRSLSVDRVGDYDRLATDGRLIESAFRVIGTRSAMTLLREAFLGARRFDDLVGRAGLSSMSGAARLKEFVAAGLMVKVPYQSVAGTRCEYVLTDLGTECLPVVLALMNFGNAMERSVPGAIEEHPQ